MGRVLPGRDSQTEDDIIMMMVLVLVMMVMVMVVVMVVMVVMKEILPGRDSQTDDDINDGDMNYDDIKEDVEIPPMLMMIRRKVKSILFINVKM